MNPSPKTDNPKPLSPKSKKVLVLCICAVVMHALVLITSYGFGPSADLRIPGLIGNSFVGYSIWLGFLGYPGLAVYPVIIIMLAVRGHKVWAVGLLLSNYAYGIWSYFHNRPKLNLTDVWAASSIETYSSWQAIFLHVIPMILLHLMYYRALTQKTA
jgi:hypothetical protein